MIFVEIASKLRRFGVIRWSLLAFAGYLLLAYALIPAIWQQYEGRHSVLDDSPRITTTHDGHPGDPINVSLVGCEADLQAIMKAANWFVADPLGLRTDFEIGADSILKRTYEHAPVSNLYLFGRKEDFAFEQPATNNPRHRHHVRFWRVMTDEESKISTWIGSASFDNRIGISHTTGQVTHHIEADVDAERDYLAECLRRTGMLTSESKVLGFHDSLQGWNGGGDPWHTDGSLWAGAIRE